MEKIIKTSKYYKYGDGNYIYHSLLGNLVLLDKKNKIFFNTNEIKKKDLKNGNTELYNYLIKKKFLVKQNEDDEIKNAYIENNIKRYNELILSNGIVFMITGECNLNCTYCIQKETKILDGTISEKIIETALKKFKEIYTIKKSNKKISISITGGEATIYPDIIKNIVKKAKEILGESLNFRLITNGTLFTSDLIDLIINEKFNISISMDSLENEKRLNAKTDTIIQNIKELIHRDAEVALSSVFDLDNIDNFNIYFLSKMQEIGIKKIALNIDNMKIPFYSKKEIKTIVNRLMLIRVKALEYNINVGGLWAAPYINIIEKRYLPAFCSGKCKSLLFVGPKGNLFYCEYMPEIYGNILDDNFIVNIINAKKEIFGSEEMCQGCEIEGFCAPCSLEKQLFDKNSKKILSNKCYFLKCTTKALLKSAKT